MFHCAENGKYTIVQKRIKMINHNPRRQGLKSDTTSRIPGTLH